MLLYVFCALGIGLFSYGLCLFLRNKADIEALKIYGLTSYVGFVIALIAIENIAITLLSVIPTQAVTQFVIFVDIVVLAVAAHFLLRPGFKGTHMINSY